MRRVKETVAGVYSASANKLIIREAKYNKAKICVISERLGEAALRN
jgi:hypothetical protein